MKIFNSLRRPSTCQGSIGADGKLGLTVTKEFW